MFGTLSCSPCLPTRRLGQPRGTRIYEPSFESQLCLLAPLLSRSEPYPLFLLLDSWGTCVIPRVTRRLSLQLWAQRLCLVHTVLYPCTTLQSDRDASAVLGRRVGWKPIQPSTLFATMLKSGLQCTGAEAWTPESLAKRARSQVPVKQVTY